MARSISASVGRMGGVNRPPDVKTVQELLNKVPPPEGGPKVRLAVDGICGPKTINAIQTFQLRHFGWKGADGRVDPNGPTLAKLNEYDVPGAQVYMLSIRCVLEPGRFLDPRRTEHWFFEVREIGKAARAVYHLSGDFEGPPAHAPVGFMGEVRTFPCGHPASGLASRAATYMTTYATTSVGGDVVYDKPRPTGSRLGLGFLSPSAPGRVILVGQGVRIPGVEHLDIYPGAHIEPPSPPDRGKEEPVETPPMIQGYVPFRTKWGRFNLVKCTPG
ncbi:MAG: peptidoglycan-binding domain-containing protein [bacterium]|nr:peptidoglycan-binding domain-containing protein [bacterium]